MHVTIDVFIWDTKIMRVKLNILFVRLHLKPKYDLQNIFYIVEKFVNMSDIKKKEKKNLMITLHRKHKLRHLKHC